MTGIDDPSPKYGRHEMPTNPDARVAVCICCLGARCSCSLNAMHGADRDPSRLSADSPEPELIPWIKTYCSTHRRWVPREMKEPIPTYVGLRDHKLGEEP